jgi:hypothetical protein
MLSDRYFCWEEEYAIIYIYIELVEEREWIFITKSDGRR